MLPYYHTCCPTHTPGPALQHCPGNSLETQRRAARLQPGRSRRMRYSHPEPSVLQTSELGTDMNLGSDITLSNSDICGVVSAHSELCVLLSPVTQTGVESLQQSCNAVKGFLLLGNKSKLINGSDLPVPSAF